MPQISYRANLSAAIFPLSLSQAGRAVIVPGPDNNYDRRVDPEGEQKDAGIPQAIYLENVIPTANGYQSVGKVVSESLPTPTLAPYVISQAPVKLPSGNNDVYTVTFAYVNSPDRLYCSIIGTGFWQPVTFVGTAAYPTFYKKISYAIVRGTCYILIADAVGSRLYTARIVGATVELTDVTASVTYLTTASIVAICGAYNYLVAFDAQGKLFWSSTTNPLDFTPSLVTGAGEAIPNNTYGGFSASYSTHFGFFMFVRIGVIAAIYTGNARYPWKFVPVNDTNQVKSAATQDPNSLRVFAHDAANNIYVLNEATATPIAPEIAAYLRINRLEYTYNYTTNTFESFRPVNILPPKLYCFYDRYICMSVGARTYSPGYAYSTVLVYDMHLKRYGRLVHPHTDLVVSSAIGVGSSFSAINGNTGEIVTFDLSFISDLSTGSDTTKSILVLGKFQYVRSRRLQLEEINFDGEFGNVSCKVFPSEPNTGLTTAVDTDVASASTTNQQFTTHTEGSSLSVALIGHFVVDSVELTMHLGGGR